MSETDMGRYADGDVIRIFYESRRLTTGLSDVKVTVWNDTPAVVVDDQTMTELGNGIYYYDYTISSTGNFLCMIDSVTEPNRTTGHFFVGAFGSTATGLTLPEFIALK